MQWLTNEGDLERLGALRRDIHAHPELGYQEQRTSDLVAATLSGWGIPVHRGLGKTGVVGILKGANSARAVGLRADMDALPITERNTNSCTVPLASRNVANTSFPWRRMSMRRPATRT